MSHVALAAEDPLPSASIRSSPALKTGQQIGILLSILREAGQFLANGESEDHTDKAETDARIETSKTLGDACLQLRNIIDEQTRWTLEDTSDALQQAMERAERDIAASRLATIQNMNRPCIMLAAKVRFFQNTNCWVAWVGELVSGTLHGSGPTPEAALQAFDIVYARGFSTPPVPVSPPPVSAPKNKRKPHAK